MVRPGIPSLARNAAFLAGTQAVGIVARIAWVLVATRLLGPELYGLLAYSQAWQLAFLPLAIFGVGPAMAYVIAPDRGRAREVAAQSLALRVVTTLLAALACLALSRAISPDPRAGALIAVLVVALAGRSVAMWAQTLFAAFEVNRHTLRQESSFALLDLAAALAILLAGGSLLELVAAKAAVALLQAGTSLATVHRHVVPLSLDWRPAGWRPLLALALPALAITLATDWRFNGALVLFRNFVPDGALFAQLALAMQALAIAGILPLAVSGAAYPALRRAVVRGDGRDLDYASAVQRAAPLAGAAAGLAGLALGEPLFRALFGAAYGEAGRLTGFTMWCVLPLVAGFGWPQVLVARGRFAALVWLNVLGALAMTAAMVLLAPRAGGAGAVAAVFLGMAVPPAGALALAWREGLARPGRELGPSLAAAAAGCAAYAALAGVSTVLALAAGLAALAAVAAALGAVGLRDLGLAAPAADDAASPPRRVLVLASTLPRRVGDSVPRFVLDQAVALRRLRPELEVRILAPHDPGAAPEEVLDGIPVHRFRYAWPERAERLAYPAILPNLTRNPLLWLLVPGLFVAELVAVLRLARRWRPDVVYSHWFTPQALVGSAAARALGVPHVFTTHSTDAAVLGRLPVLGPWLARRVTRRAAAFTAVSRRTLARLQAHFPDPAAWAEVSARGRLVPMGVDVAALAGGRGEGRAGAAGGDGPLVLFLGRLTAKKGLPDLLEAFRAVAAAHPRARLCIAGEGEERTAVGRRVSALGLEGRVELAGFVAGERKRALLLAADVLAVPSVVAADGDAEGLPVALLEGLAAGAACVATDASGADDVIEDGANGFLVPAGDPAALAAALLRALALGPAERAALSARARETARAFDWAAVAEAHWEHLLARPARS